MALAPRLVKLLDDRKNSYETHRHGKEALLRLLYEAVDLCDYADRRFRMTFVACLAAKSVLPIGPTLSGLSVSTESDLLYSACGWTMEDPKQFKSFTFFINGNNDDDVRALEVVARRCDVVAQ